MTYRERLAKEHPELGGRKLTMVGCPHYYGYCNQSETVCGREGHRDCSRCWYQEMPEEPAVDIYKDDSSIGYGKIQDSGERQEFATGAVRDIQKGKGRCDLMPLEVVCKYLRKPIFGHLNMFLQDCDTGHLYECLSLFSSYYGEKTNMATDCTMFLEVAKHFEEGAEKYGENNWQKGLPAQCYINSAVRHYLKWLRGDKDERHDRAFVWNLMCCIWEVDYSPRVKEKIQEPKKKDLVRLGNCYSTHFEFEGHICVMTDIVVEGGNYIVVDITNAEHRALSFDVMVRPLTLKIDEVDGDTGE